MHLCAYPTEILHAYCWNAMLRVHPAEQGHIFTEDDWTIEASETKLPYTCAPLVAQHSDVYGCNPDAQRKHEEAGALARPPRPDTPVHPSPQKS